jgi:hypothetical protein
VFVEFVPRAKLDEQDRKVLTVLGHPLRTAQASPMFRAIRPGFHPWYVTEDGGRLLVERMRAVVLICSAVSAQADLKYWDRRLSERRSHNTRENTVHLIMLLASLSPPTRLLGSLVAFAVTGKHRRTGFPGMAMQVRRQFSEFSRSVDISLTQSAVAW